MEQENNESKEKSIDKEFSDLRHIIEPEKELKFCGFQLNDLNIEQVKMVTQINVNNKKEKDLELADGRTFNPDQYLFLWKQHTMLPSYELDLLSDRVKSAKLPDMFYGYNRFFIIFPQSKNFMIEINPLQMLNFTNFEVLNQTLIDVNSDSNTDKQNLTNCSYYYPSEVKSQFHEKWKNIKLPEKTEVQSLKAVSDWCYNSPYMGNLSQFYQHGLYNEFLKGNYQYLKPYVAKEGEFSKISFKRELTKETIPFNKLSPENPVLKYWEVPLYDDELNDDGLSMGSFRFRVMKDCFFGLLRSYLRLDNVVIRIVDTRIYHELGTNEILRDFQVRENTYSEIKSKGFDLGSQWSLNHSQSDLIYNTLDIKLHVNDKVTIIES